ncbi:MAG: twin-arginine translocase TatA/TatE family subunit [Verrucomicrobiales bacterium]|nr:twin-arginine translocase TatA/TatE family subunit [Verrucomicrobiales bacterium]
MKLISLAMLGSTEILVIAVVVLVLFGAKKVPELMKGVGTGIKEFKKASRDVQDELHRAMDEVERTPPPAPPPSATASVPVPQPDPGSHAHDAHRAPEQKA